MKIRFQSGRQEFKVRGLSNIGEEDYYWQTTWEPDRGKAWRIAQSRNIECVYTEIVVRTRVGHRWEQDVDEGPPPRPQNLVVIPRGSWTREDDPIALLKATAAERCARTQRRKGQRRQPISGVSPCW